jgi:hypothetical protein
MATTDRKARVQGRTAIFVAALARLPWQTVRVSYRRWVARTVSTVEIMQYGRAMDYPLGRVRPVPEKRCKRCGGSLEVVERGRQGRDPWEPVLWEPVIYRCPNGCLPKHAGLDQPKK